MDGEERIIKAILDAARADAHKLGSEAEAESAAILDAAHKNASERALEITDESKRKAHLVKTRAISAARLTASKTDLKARRDAINHAISLALNKLNGLPETDSDAYTKIILDMVRSTGAGSGAVIILREEDKAQAKKLASLGYLVKTEKSEPGFRLVDGDIEYNCTFSAILAANREIAEKVAVNALFGKA